MVKYIKRILGFIIIAITLTFSGCTAKSVDNIPKIENGVLDLSKWNMETDGTFRLDGDWDFYWNRLLTYDDIKQEEPDLYANIPNSWNRYQLDGNHLPGTGFATYRLHIKSELAQNTILGLRLNTFSSAYRLFINEKEISSIGTVATNAEEEVGCYRPQTIFFAVPAQEFDIIIQVSNYEYARGGFWYSVSMGSQEGIVKLQNNLIGKELVLVCVLLISSLSCFIIYQFKKELKYLLYFSALCFLATVAIDFLGQYLFYQILEGMSLKAIILMWYFSVDAVLFLLILLVHSLYRSKISTIIYRAYSAIIILSGIVILFTDTLFYTRFAQASNFVETLGVLCTVIIVIVGIINGHKEGWFHMCCLIIIFIAYAHDTLYWTNSISSGSGEILYFGLFFCLLLQIIMLTRKVKEFYNKLTSTELLFLQAQIKPHFLYNSLNTIISISYYDVDRSRELLDNFANYLRHSFDIKVHNQYVPLKNEIELAKAYTEIEKGRFEERLEVNFDVQVSTEVKVPMLILQPIIENAIIHGVLPKPEGGCVNISIRQEGKLLTFRVEDDGIGMNKEYDNKQLKSKSESGVGLTNIAKRLKRLYGSILKIEDNPTGGTIVTWKIPMNRKERYK